MGDAGYTLSLVVLAVGLGLALLCALAVPACALRRRPTAAAAVPTGGALFGRVWRPDGVAVPAVVLTILGEDGGEIARARTDAAGDYRVELADPGRYLVVASHAGYRPHAAEVQVNGELAELSLIMPSHHLGAAPPPYGSPFVPQQR